MRVLQSFTLNKETDKELIDYLNTKPNKAKYIKETLIKDMNAGQQNNVEELLNEIKKILLSMQGNEVVPKEKKETNKFLDALKNNLDNF